MALYASRQSAYSEYTPEERVEMGRYGAKNGLFKVTKPFSFSLL